MLQTSIGVLLPFVGTAVGAGCVYFIKKEPRPMFLIICNGFAAGVMIAASVWSLLLPAIEASHALGKLAFLPAVTGIWLGIGFLILLHKRIPLLHSEGKDAYSQRLNQTKWMALAVVLHNIPEGMAVGAAFAGVLFTESNGFAAALTLSFGIAVQNLPEGAIISMPLYLAKTPKNKAFAFGVLSGAVEPLAAILTILLSSVVVPLLPVFLSFAAGAMIWVVVDDLLSEGDDAIKESCVNALSFSVGFCVMMMLDVALG